MACGYGKALPTGRHMNPDQEIREGLDMTAAVIAVCTGSCDDGTCGACGACGWLKYFLKFTIPSSSSSYLILTPRIYSYRSIYFPHFYISMSISR